MSSAGHYDVDSGDTFPKWTPGGCFAPLPPVPAVPFKVGDLVQLKDHSYKGTVTKLYPDSSALEFRIPPNAFAVRRWEDLEFQDTTVPVKDNNPHNLIRYSNAWDKIAAACAKMTEEQIEQLAVSVAQEQNDVVNHPSHYTSHPSGIECIEVTRHFNFSLGNVIKYIWRAPLKGASIEDLKKARFYLNDEIRQMEKGS